MTQPGTALDDPKYKRLVELVAEAVNLQKVGSLLFWDQQCMMPKGGAGARGSHMAVVGRLAHEKFTSPEVGHLLEELRDLEASLPYDSDEASFIRVTRREYEKLTRVPPDLVARMSRVQNESFQVWLKAREEKDYRVFRPALENVYAVRRELAEALGYKEHPMDPLVDRYEPGLTVKDIETLFDELRAALVPLVRAITDKARGQADPATILQGNFPHDAQLAAGREAVRAIGFDLDTRGRLDLSVHPYTVDICPDDVRITTRVNEQYVGQSFFACLHEAGHGLYAQGIPTRFQESPLGDGASAGLHESQSRLWENIVGRSRAFWEFFLPRMKEHFPSLGSVTVEDMYRAVNKVETSLIRVEADEVTYNLHIMVRWELEKAVFDGKLALADLAEAWNAKFEEYLGIRPPDDLVGVLQDIHWTSSFGAAFPGYTIGNVASIQLYERALADHPDLEAEFARGKFDTLLGWMQRNVHAHGAKFTPQELLTRVTGRPLTAEPYLRYIRRKFGELYGV
ncbi:MAG: carboxypeptidase M32 [Firmicutes bacterium]|nr:carboxypeptidase M32 [Bacillota bacterium]